MSGDCFATICGPKTIVPTPSNLLVLAAAIGPETRQPPLGDVAHALSPTGSISCGNNYATAQLTGAGNVLTTVAHIFQERDCTERFEQECYFWPADGSDRKFRIRRESVQFGGCAYENRDKDWAVIRLDEEVTGLGFYNIPAVERPPLVGDTLLMAAYGDQDIGRGLSTHACQVRDLSIFDRPVQTDCHGGERSSGAAQLLMPNGNLALNNLTLSAIHAGQSDTIRNGAPYQTYSQYSYSIPLQGDFLRAVRTAIIGRPPSRPVQ